MRGTLPPPPPTSSRAPELHSKLRHNPTPRSRGPAPCHIGYLRSNPRGAEPGRAASQRRPRHRRSCGESLRARPCAPTFPAPCALQAGGRARPARDLGAAAARAPRRMSLMQLGQERDVATPRKLGEFRSLARPELAPRAGDTSGRLRTPRLLAGGLCQRPPAPPLEPKELRPAPGPPSASPSVAPPAPACGARTSLRRPPARTSLRRGQEDTRAGGGWRPRRLRSGCRSCPRDRVRGQAVRLDSLQCLPPSHAALPASELQ